MRTSRESVSNRIAGASVEKVAKRCGERMRRHEERFAGAVFGGRHANEQGIPVQLPDVASRR